MSKNTFVSTNIAIKKHGQMLFTKSHIWLNQEEKEVIMKKYYRVMLGAKSIYAKEGLDRGFIGQSYQVLT